MGSQLLAVILLLQLFRTGSRAVDQKADENAGSCWSIGFTHETCCGSEHGPEGNTECWDDVYTFESCCLGRDLKEAGCDSGFFTRFRGLVWEYYKEGRSKPALIQQWPRILANYDARFLLCAPAALQAHLLQIEERGFLERPESVMEQLLSYTQNLQQATGAAVPGRLDLKSWPLELGLERLRQNVRIKARQMRFRNFPDVTLVLSYCREELSWMNASFSRRVMPLVDVVVVAKCVDVDGVAAVPFRHLWRSVEQLDVEDLPLRADECSAYLGYLHHNYYKLPRHMVFVHADMPEHIGAGRPNIVDDTLRALSRGASVPFAHLGNNRVTMRWNPHLMTPLWKGLFGSTIAPAPGEVSTYCCSHMVVSRERALVRSRRFYQTALELVTSPASYFYLPAKWRPAQQSKAADFDMKGRLVCQNMMFLWHVIFGAPLHLPHRMYDPSLPLFLKTRNIRTVYLEDDSL
ncbi:unnamed protein product [Effrenium voratum]|nr:unnamed protein product [Effrenium voratum]